MWKPARVRVRRAASGAPAAHLQHEQETSLLGSVVAHTQHASVVFVCATAVGHKQRLAAPYVAALPLDAERLSVGGRRVGPHLQANELEVKCKHCYDWA